MSEFEEALAKNDEMGRREAAEKAWLAVIEATDTILGSGGISVTPGRSAHAERKRSLEQMGRRDLSQEYSIFADQFHGDCFYDGICPTDAELRLKLQSASQFVDEAHDAD